MSIFIFRDCNFYIEIKIYKKSERDTKDYQGTRNKKIRDDYSKRSYSDNFKAKLVDMCNESGNIAEIAREFRIPYSTLYNWVCKNTVVIEIKITIKNKDCNQLSSNQYHGQECAGLVFVVVPQPSAPVMKILK